MIFTAFGRAVSQASDPRFLRVLLLGVGLTLGLLIAITALFVWGVNWLLPDTFSMPWIGEISWVDDVASAGSIFLMLVLSVFLMIPVASAFTGIFLEDVAAAVESRYYPHLPGVPRIPWSDALRDSLAFLGVIVAVNLVALVLYFFVGPFAPLLFWAVNGFLLGREYFQLVAMRRLGRKGAIAARKRHSATIWAAGILMAAPLSIPVVNLFVPILGAATFTHIFHALERPAGD
ncbi:MAG: EI24 domain-containing protein [Pseudomonadota bacterium]